MVEDGEGVPVTDAPVRAVVVDVLTVVVTDGLVVVLELPLTNTEEVVEDAGPSTVVTEVVVPGASPPETLVLRG